MEFQDRLFAAAGHYLPSFFKMEVFSSEPLSDIDQLSETAASIYFHEYLHYVQDVATFHGLSNMIRMGEYLHHAIERVKSGPPEFQVPIEPDTHSGGVEATINIIKLLNGGSGTDDLQVVISSVDYQKIDLKAFHGGTVPEVILTYNGHKTYSFGATAVTESMAWIGEHHFFPKNAAPAQFPYRAAELLAGFLFPEFAADPLNLFALCDIALLTAEPGAAFYQKLLVLQKAGFVPGNPRDIYHFFENDRFEYNGAMLGRSAMLSTLVHTANIYLSGYFPGEQYSANVEWMRHVTVYGFSLRHANMAFPLDILLYGSFYQNPHLKQVMRYIGSPLQLNSDDRASYVMIDDLDQEKFQPDLNWAIAEIQKVFIGRKTGCKMKTFCKESAYQQGIPDFTNAYCDSEPWQRVREQEDCSFVRIVNLWGLHDKFPLFDAGHS